MRRLPLLEPPSAPRDSTYGGQRVALISVTTYCNARCPFCCVLDTLNKPELNPPDERLFEELERRRAEGCTVLSFTGGEPTIHPRFVELCRRGRELGYEAITINTNGIKFQDRKFAEAALDAGLSSIDFSIHGHDEPLQDAMMGKKGAFRALRRGLENLRELAAGRDVRLGSTTVVTTENAPHLNAIVDFLIDAGIQSLRFKHCFESVRTAELGLVPEYQRYMANVREAARRAVARGRGVLLTHFPLCLLGDEAALASDFAAESVTTVDFSGDAVLESRATMHRRASSHVCERCALSSTCTQLDRAYERELGDALLRPLVSRTAAGSFVRSALDTYPNVRLEAWLRAFMDHRPAPRAQGVGPSETESPMSIGFISPTFRVLEVNWEQDYEMVKLGVPTFMGYLFRAGLTNCQHWDFDADICEACAIDPSAFDLRQYFDEALVAGFIQGTDQTLRAQTEKLLDTLGVTRKAVFGLSMSAVLDRISNLLALGRVVQCLAVVLRERYPDSKIVIGGLQASPDSLQPGIYRQLLEGCPAIDYAWIGQAENPAVQLYRNLLNGQEHRNKGLGARLVYREGGKVVQGDDSLPRDLDADLDVESSLRKGLPVHTQTGKLEESCAVDDDKLVAAIDLVRRRHYDPQPGSRANDYDSVNVEAAQAGDQPWDEIPAAVPVFDPNVVDRFRYSGLQIMKRFHFDKEKMLRFSRFEDDKIVVLPHIFIRGCNAPCGFCAYAYSKIEGEELEKTIAGLKFLSETYDCKHFHFLNTQINSVYRYAEMFCDRLIETKLDILWSDCCNMRSLDEPLLEKMRRSGAMRLVFGIEAPEDEMLQMIHKGINTARIERLLKASHDLGIWNHMLLIAGMPHETKAKQDRMMEFLTRTAPTVDFYSISSFYLISTSPWGRDPAKYGIERISDPSGLLEEQAFNEIAGGRYQSDGLKWPEKKQQIIDSTQRFYRTVSTAKGQSRCAAGNIDLYMLMFLYRALGHDQKAEIAKIYAETAREFMGGETQSLPANKLRVKYPYIARRVNEADQSALLEVSVDLQISEATADAKGIVNTGRWVVSWSIPQKHELKSRLTAAEHQALEDSLTAHVARLTEIVGPFATALDKKLQPSTPERMAELLATNLRRYPKFTQWFSIASVGTRQYLDRALEWSGLRRDEAIPH